MNRQNNHTCESTSSASNPALHQASSLSARLRIPSGLTLLVWLMGLASTASLQAAKPAAPDAPSSPSAFVVSSTQVNFTWQDNSLNESGFIIQRSSTPVGPWTQIGATSQDVQSYSDPGLSGGNTYYYRVCAYNSRGSSSFTPTVSATTTSSCTYSISPGSASPAASGASSSVSVTAGPTCSWTATSSASWITITSGGSGTGNGSVSYTVAANTSTSPRTSTMTIAGSTFTVNQSGATSSCTYVLSSTSASPSANGGPGSVGVTAGSTCSWTATSGAAWITITAGASGTGNGTVSYTVAANGAASSRTGTLTIAGQTYTVTQAADTTPPSSVTLTAPTSGASLSGTASFTGTASDNIAVARMEFWCDGSTLLGTATAAPYSVSYNTAGIPNGTRAFTCKAYDVAGNSTASTAVSAVVSNSAAPAGQAQLVKTMLSTPNGMKANGWSVATDASGNMIVAGDFNGTVDFGGGVTAVSISGFDAFVAKYNAQGSLLWAKTFGGIMDQSAKSVAVDSQGNVIVAGSFSSTVNFGGIQLTAPDPLAFFATDMFVMKYSPSGSLLWVRQFGGDVNDFANAVAVDASDNIVLAGRFTSQNVNFGNGIILSSAGNFDLALVKLSPAGATVWAKRYGGANDEMVNAVALDASGDIVVTGQFNVSANLGGATITGGSSYSSFVAKYAGADGSHRWSKGFGDSTVDAGNAITTDPRTGNVIVTGGFKGTANFDGGTVANASTKTGSGETVYLAGYGPTGNFLWVTPIGGGSGTMDWGSAVKIGANGNLALTGSKGNPWNINGTWDYNAGFFVMSFTIAGDTAPVTQWVRTPGTGSNGGSVGNGITFDSAGQVYTTGSFCFGTVNFGGISATTLASSYSAYLTKYSN